MKLSFVRHGEHEGERSELTNFGKQEMGDVKERLEFNDTIIVFYPPGSRFQESAEILLGERDSDYKRREVRDLSYLRINQKTSYYEGLIDSIRARRCLEYHVLFSDAHIQESGEHISSYTTMAALTSRLLLKYINIQNRLPEGRNIDIQRVFCAREFIWASFRAKLIELKYGKDEMLEYVDWYSNTQEGNPEARKNIANITFNSSLGSSMTIHLSDKYGEEDITISDLENIIQQEQALLESSVQD
jgi:hypothetical protein